MLHLRNDTPYQAGIFAFPDRHGIDVLCVTLKATYDIKSEFKIAEEQQPIIMEDTYWGEPGESSLKYPAEVTPEKPGTDVILIGEACAPAGYLEMSVGISAAGRKLAMKIFGDRYWEKGLLRTKPSDPEPFERMPIIYERAYGGTHVIDHKAGKILSELRNPIGKGFAGKRSADELEVIGVPNIEDPQSLINSPSNKGNPVGYGAIAPNWQPRFSYIGTYDETWQKKRAPFLPDDFNPLHFHAAHPDLIFPKRLKGGDAFIINGMSPNGRKAFNLPSDEPKIRVNITGRFMPEKAWISTVLLEPTDERISVVWLAAASHGKRIREAEAKISL